MDTISTKKKPVLEILKFISIVISWTIFTLLIICAILLIYYFISLRIYVAKGSGYEPKFSLYTIISGSMTPNINVYDVIVDVKVDSPEDIKIGDVITFNAAIPGANGSTITHRVIAINKDTGGNYYYKTKGDYNLVDDGVEIPFSSIVGKVALRIPGLGRVQSIMTTKAGWLLLVLIPALYIIVKDIFKIIKLKNEDNKIGKTLSTPLIGFKKRKLLPYKKREENMFYDGGEEDVELPHLKSNDEDINL